MDTMMDVFLAFTTQVIQKCAPVEYHTSKEWEYETVNGKEEVKLLVWKMKHREDKPYEIEFKGSEKETIGMLCEKIHKVVKGDLD